MYSCNICNFQTEVRTAIYNHNKSKKHIANIQNIELSNEKKSTEDKEQEIDNLKKQLAEKDKEIEKLELINKVYKEQGENKVKNINNGTMNNNITNNITYVNKNFGSAPPLEKISNFVINGIDINDSEQHDKFIDNIIYHHNMKNLNALIGDHIIANYKKTNLSEQSFHTTDTSRLNYVVRLIEDITDFYEISSDEDEEESEIEKLKNEYFGKIRQLELKKKIDAKNKIWSSDKNGYKICSLLIDPTIRKIVRIIKNKCKSYNKKFKIDNIDKIKSLSDILINIDTKKLRDDTNKYISPYFNLIQKK